MSSEEMKSKLSQLVNRASTDERLKEGLLNHPMPLLKENGIEVPEGTEVRVVADKDTITFSFEPTKQGESTELSEGALSSVAGGAPHPVSGKQPIVYLRYTMTNVTV
jgi:hypothetical protein